MGVGEVQCQVDLQRRETGVYHCIPESHRVSLFSLSQNVIQSNYYLACSYSSVTFKETFELGQLKIRAISVRGPHIN